MPVGSLIVGVDLDAIRAIRGCKTLVGDITTQKTRQVLTTTPQPVANAVLLHNGTLSRLMTDPDYSQIFPQPHILLSETCTRC